MTDAELIAFVRTSTAASGVPERLEDDAVIAEVAGILASEAEDGAA